MLPSNPYPHPPFPPHPRSLAPRHSSAHYHTPPLRSALLLTVLHTTFLSTTFPTRWLTDHNPHLSSHSTTSPLPLVHLTPPFHAPSSPSYSPTRGAASFPCASTGWSPPASAPHQARLPAARRAHPPPARGGTSPRSPPRPPPGQEPRPCLARAHAIACSGTRRAPHTPARAKHAIAHALGLARISQKYAPTF